MSVRGIASVRAGSIHCSLNAGIAGGLIMGNSINALEEQLYRDETMETALSAYRGPHRLLVTSLSRDLIDCIDKQICQKRLPKIRNAAGVKCILTGGFVIDRRHENHWQIGAR